MAPTALRGRTGAGGDGFVRGPAACVICGRGAWWCRLRVTPDGRVQAWCRNMSDGAVATTRNAYGDEYIFDLAGDRRVRAEAAARAVPVGALAPLPPEALHAMHCYLLGAHLRLPDWARAIVRDRRSLTDDQIDAEGYGYLPREGRARIARALLERFGDDAMHLPGMYTKTDEATGASWPSLGGAVGLVVPVRTLVEGDPTPRVVALKVRSLDADAPKEHRFTYVSSNRHGGCAAVVAPHYPAAALELRAAGRRDVVLVESEISAAVVTALSGRPAVAVAGISNALRLGPAVARAWPADAVRLAFDQDPKPETRAKVARIARDLAAALRAANVAVRVWEWPAADDQKGPDDFLQRRQARLLNPGHEDHAA